MPARAGHPRDKAKVEAGVLVAQRWVLARLRNQVFFSLSELNERLTRWSLPNFDFHLVTAYDILRHNGVAIGKPDYMSQLREFIAPSKSLRSPAS
jgi:hypothetical protein